MEESMPPKKLKETKLSSNDPSNFHRIDPKMLYDSTNFHLNEVGWKKRSMIWKNEWQGCFSYLSHLSTPKQN